MADTTDNEKTDVRLRIALCKIREAGNNLDPTMQWAQKMAAWAIDPKGTWPYPGDTPPEDKGQR